MTKLSLIVAVVALLVGLTAGYVWWGASGRHQDSEARSRLAQQLDEAQTKQQKAQEALKALEARLRDLEGELDRERQRRARLEIVVSEGRK